MNDAGTSASGYSHLQGAPALIPAQIDFLIQIKV